MTWLAGRQRTSYRRDTDPLTFRNIGRSPLSAACKQFYQIKHLQNHFILRILGFSISSDLFVMLNIQHFHQFLLGNINILWLDLVIFWVYSQMSICLCATCPFPKDPSNAKIVHPITLFQS